MSMLINYMTQVEPERRFDLSASSPGAAAAAAAGSRRHHGERKPVHDVSRGFAAIQRKDCQAWWSVRHILPSMLHIKRHQVSSAVGNVSILEDKMAAKRNRR
ncbi:uncharacterized protein LOC143033661 [Oratosquilla oratoria]|uniref:uncharacterized protein LOC143033661 n=1 Tax=Oratosquilla oratoria TaxID=337810 RepID=UPI003F764741